MESTPKRRSTIAQLFREGARVNKSKRKTEIKKTKPIIASKQNELTLNYST